MEPLRIENDKGNIESMSLEDWKPLLGLIPVIEKTETFATPGVISYPGKDTVEFGPSKQAAVVYTFSMVVYQVRISIDVDWSPWEEGKRLVENPDTDYESIDIPTKCKLITAFVRNDRFCSGALASRCKEGTILRILTSIRHQILAAT